MITHFSGSPNHIQSESECIDLSKLSAQCNKVDSLTFPKVSLAHHSCMHFWQKGEKWRNIGTHATLWNDQWFHSCKSFYSQVYVMHTGGPPLTQFSLPQIPLPRFLAYVSASGGFLRIVGDPTNSNFSLRGFFKSQNQRWLDAKITIQTCQLFGIAATVSKKHWIWQILQKI